MIKSFTISLLVVAFLGGIYPSYAKKTSDDFINIAKKELPKQCLFFFKMYLNAKEHKAFAYAIDNNSKYTCRFSSGSKSRERAKKVALKSCQKSKKSRNIKDECKLYEIDLKGFTSQRGLDFINNYRESIKKIESVLKKEANISNDKNSTTNQKKSSKKFYTTLEEIENKKSTKAPKKSTQKNKPKQKISNANLKSKKSAPPQTKKSKFPKACTMFFNLYKSSQGYKAFSIAVDSESKFICKFSAKSKSMKRAKEVALRSCNKSRAKREVKAECHIIDFQASKAPTKRAKPSNKKLNKVTKRVRDPQLEKAILNTDLPLIKKLIRRGADVNTEANDHSRAIFVATAKGDIKFVKELLDKGADPYFKKGDGNNLLVAAIMSGKLEMLKIILDEGVDPNEQCNEGNTPLHFAFMMFDDAMMRALYKAGASDEIPNDKGETVKGMAKAYNVDLSTLKRDR